MIKRQPRPIISETKEYENQFFSWLHDSHYWIEDEKCDGAICKWCGAIALPLLNSSRLCMKNPEILRILSKEDNPVNAT
jgi:hypothetical protein